MNHDRVNGGQPEGELAPNELKSSKSICKYIDGSWKAKKEH